MSNGELNSLLDAVIDNTVTSEQALKLIAHLRWIQSSSRPLRERLAAIALRLSLENRFALAA